MFVAAGAVGIFSIGIVGGFYFARYFDANEQLATPAFVTLLTVIGLGPSALALITAYRDLNLLDPYGLGVLIGVVANLVLQVTAKQILRRRGAAAINRMEVAADARDGSDAWVALSRTVLSLTSSAATKKEG